MRRAVVAASLVLLGGGLYAYDRLDIEAYPNPVPPMIEVITQPVGSARKRSSDSSPSRSRPRWRACPAWNTSAPSHCSGCPTSSVTSRGAPLQGCPPGGLEPPGDGRAARGSAANAVARSPICEIDRYVLRGDAIPSTDLKSAQDGILDKQFRQAPGVVDVVGFGGDTKQYHVEIDPVRLRAHALTLTR